MITALAFTALWLLGAYAIRAALDVDDLSPVETAALLLWPVLAAWYLLVDCVARISRRRRA